jgi:hypothetical protein
MTIMTIRRFVLALPLAVLALDAHAQTAPYDIEIGVRIVTVDGNRDMYRSQTDETSGLLLRSFSLLTPGPDGAKFFDRLRIDASDLGAGPAGSLRIEADKAGAYRFRLGYRHMNLFSALPAFANPLLGSGITTSQHTYDRTRNMVDADLELFPDGRVMPFIGYSFNRISGPGTSTYTIGGDEFRLAQSLEESEHEFRIGAGFHLGLLRGSVTQGWRSVRGNESLSLVSSSGDGNNPDPLLGRAVLASGIVREDRTHVSTPFTNLYVTAQLAAKLRLTGNFVRFAADSTADGSENTAGSFVSFALNRFFNGLAEQASSQAKNTTWRGGARAEFAVLENIDAFAGYQKEHRDLDGSALIDTLFLQTLTFGGVDPRDVERVLNAHGLITRSEDVVNAGASMRALGPFAIRVELRDAKQNVAVSPDLSEIVVPGNQGGQFERNIRTLDTNASYTISGFTLGAAWRQDRANQPIFRTDFRDRDRLRLRATWRAPKWIRAGATAEETSQSNAQPGIDLAGKSRQYGGDVEVTPHEGVAVRGSVTRFITNNSILIRRPENFATDRSLYAENGTSYEAGGGIRRAALSFDASIARFTNRGDHAFDLDRFRLTAGCDLPPKTKMGFVIEFARDKYRERDAAYSDFDAKRVGVFLRYHP